MPLTVAALQSQLMHVLSVDLAVDARGLDHTSLLFSTGLIDSVGLVQLADAVESLSGVRIPDRDVSADHFDSIDHVEAYLRRRGALTD